MSVPGVSKLPFPRPRRWRPWLARLAVMSVVATMGLAGAGWSAPAQASPLTWQRQTAPGPAGSGLNGISCTGSGTCVAVGAVFTSNHVAGLAESETGGHWALDALPQPSGHATADLAGVSCWSATNCVAVGSTSVSRHSRVFTEIRHGTTWKIVAPAALAGVGNAELAAVSCATSTLCVAVGAWTTTSGTTGGTLAEVYNGHHWTLDKTPALSGTGSLAGVSCLTETVPALCTAVGADTVGVNSTPLVEHANGTHWTTVSVPTVPSATETSLAAVSCPQPTSCVAVGSALEGDFFHSFSEVENTLQWKLVSAPATSHGSDNLVGVSCPLSIGSCRGVGFDGVAGTLTLAETWNGSHWAIQSSADPSSLSELLAVSCVTVRTTGVACSAGGEYQDDPQAPSHPLVERN